MTKFVVIREGLPTEFTIDIHDVDAIERRPQGREDARYSWVNVIFKGGKEAYYGGWGDDKETDAIYFELRHHALACNTTDLAIESRSDVSPDNSKVEEFKNVLVETFPQLFLLEYRKIQEHEFDKKCIDAEYTFLVKSASDLINLESFLQSKGFREYGFSRLNSVFESIEQKFPAVCEISVTFEKYKELNNVLYYFPKVYPYCHGVQQLLDKLEKGEAPGGQV